MNDSSPLTIHVIVRSGSGKTTTIEYLTSHLTQLGVRVGTIKHVHKEGLSFDAVGKDTWRHARSGAALVVGVAPHELATFKPTQQETPLAEARMALNSENVDIVLVEGFSRAPSAKRSPKIVTAKNRRELEAILRLNGGPIVAVTGPVASSRWSGASRPPAPIIDLQEDKGHLIAIVRKLLRPKELRELYRAAAVKHGDECVGIAIGVRAAYIASNVLGTAETRPRMTYGTKGCVADAFRVIFPDVHPLPRGNDDAIRIENSRRKMTIQLAPKRHFRNPSQALNCPDDTLFTSVRVNPKR